MDNLKEQLLVIQEAYNAGFNAKLETDKEKKAVQKASAGMSNYPSTYIEWDDMPEENENDLFGADRINDSLGNR